MIPRRPSQVSLASKVFSLDKGVVEIAKDCDVSIFKETRIRSST